MKTLKKTLLLAFVVLTSAFSFAQNAPAKLASVQVKLMKMDGKYFIFLTNPKGDPFSNKNMTVSGKSDAGGKLTFTTYAENAFQITGTPGSFKKLSLTIHLKDTKHNEYVYATVVNKSQDESTYVCPMHADEMFKAEGKCPKCGMALVAKKVTVWDPATVVRKGSR